MHYLSKVLFLSIGTGLLTSCVNKYSVTGVVTKRDGFDYFLDTNGDTFADKAVCFEEYQDRPLIRRSVGVGDTISFTTCSDDRSKALYGISLDSINGRSFSDIKAQYDTNKLHCRDQIRKMR